LGLRRVQSLSYAWQKASAGISPTVVGPNAQVALASPDTEATVVREAVPDVRAALEPPNASATSSVEGHSAASDDSHPYEALSPRRGLSASPLLVEFALLAVALAGAAVVARREAHEPSLRWVLLYGGLILLCDRLPKSRNRLELDLLNLVRDLLLVTALSAMALLALRVLTTDDSATAAQTLTIWLTTTALLIPARIAQTRLDLRARRAGAATRKTLIVGAGRVGHLIANRLLARPELGLHPIGFLDKAPLAVERESAPLPVLGASWDLESVVARHGVQHVIFTFSTAPHHVLLRMVSRCHALGIDVSVVPRLFEKMSGRIQVDHLGGVPLLSVRHVDPLGWQFRLKYGFDRVVAFLALVLLSPILAACAVAVYLSLGRPLIFRQLRVGLDGREFEMLKFRSMHGTPDGSLPHLAPDTAPGGMPKDERTRVGRLMRKTSLDELPQLLNVVRGEMSLVGPRPERPEFARIFLQDVHRYGERLRVKSGITGWAQVNGLRGQTSLRDRVEWDNYYIENWSPWLDFKILVRTLRSVLRCAGE
jgi:exopolysaccharide biosynthesis polyprenyl glycosylphosphotransferase